MIYSFINELSESRLFPTALAVSRITPNRICEYTVVYLSAMRVLLAESENHDWTDYKWPINYVRDATQWGDFKKWRTSGNDLYVLLQAIENINDSRIRFKTQFAYDWLKDSAYGRVRPSVLYRLFTHLNSDLLVDDTSIRSMRRLAQEWDNLDQRKRKLLVTSLLQYFRSHLPEAEVLPHLDRLSHAEHLNYNPGENTTAQLLNEVERTVRLIDLYSPGELRDTEEMLGRYCMEYGLWDEAWNTPLPVKSMSPEQARSLMMRDGTNIIYAYEHLATKSQKKLVALKSQHFDSNRIIVVEGMDVLDGYHHVVAAILAERPLFYIDLADLPV